MMQHMAMRKDDQIADDWPERCSIAATHDVECSVIRIVSEGRWTPEQVDRHFDEMAMVIARTRATMGRVRVLVDRRDSLDQAPATSERIRMRADGLFSIEDRVAIVVPNCLAKLRFRGALNEQTHRVFVSEEAAIMWLKAYD